MDLELYREFTRNVLFKDRPNTKHVTAENVCEPDPGKSECLDRRIVRKLEGEVFKKLQQIQEDRIILEVGNQQFHTSRVTMKADPNSLLASLLEDGCPFRPCTSYGRPTYFFDRDSAHFRFILNFLRNGAAVDEATLPSERRYLLEMLSEARFFRLAGLEEAILSRMKILRSKSL